MRVLLVEDSAVTREFLRDLLERDPDIEWVDVARNGVEAVDMADRLRPNLIVMDVHMPHMNGYEATRAIMERFPTPIVMMSSSMDRFGVSLTFEAINAGALTVVEKPSGGDHPDQARTAGYFVETAKLMAEIKVVRRWSASPTPSRTRTISAPTNLPRSRIQLVAIGASTGGPATLMEILAELPFNLSVPIVVVQHIAEGFAQGLVEWLADGAPLRVKLAVTGEPLQAGTVYLAPPGRHMGVSRAASIHLVDGPLRNGFRPSVSHLLQSVAETYGTRGMGVVLTGMGRDGTDGLLALRKAGGVTVAQDEATCAVFGMPKAAVEAEAAEYILTPQSITGMICALAFMDSGGEPLAAQDSSCGR